MLLDIIPRIEWGAVHPRGSIIAGKQKLIVIHHTYAPHVTCGSSSKYEREVIRGIEKYHKEERGWNGIAYNFLVFQGGRCYEGRGWNREGAHTKGQNNRSVGICLVANAESHTVTEASLESIASIIKVGIQVNCISKDFDVKGHRDFAGTECPGKYLYKYLHKIKEMVNA